MSRRRRTASSGAAERGAQLGYRPALDGVRALAVVAVMLYHGGVTWAAGGFLGVDVFFVLSGFLITSLLVLEWTTTGRIALGRSGCAGHAGCCRRCSRPPCGGAYSFFVSDEQQPNLRGDSLATLAYVSNWWFMVSGQSYFGQFVEPSLLRHTWSLAIEEQFYIVFPMLLVAWLARARLGLASLRALLFVGVLASAVVMAAVHDPLSDTSRAYYGTDTRAQASRRWYDMPLRAAMVACLVAVVVGTSARVGPSVTGLLAVFPIVLTSLMLIFQPRIGGPATAALLANTMWGLAGFSTRLWCCISRRSRSAPGPPTRCRSRPRWSGISCVWSAAPPRAWRGAVRERELAFSAGRSRGSAP